jgi:predicted dehydrogenase
MRYKEWRSRSGTPWPYKDEFEVGCTLEHAGYYVTWLTTFFGPAKTVTAYSSCLVPDKLCELEVIAPDFSVACLEFASGVMARLTCSIVAPRNHSLRLMGDGGFLATDNGWDYSSPIYFKHYNHPTRGVKSKLMRLLFKSKRLRALLRHPELRYPLARKCDFHLRYGVGSHQMDFARGIAELADAITNKRPCRLSARHALHVDEIVLTMQYPERMGCPRTLRTSFEPVEPMTWAVARSNVNE